MEPIQVNNTISWETTNAYLTSSLNGFLTPFAVSLVVWDNSLPLNHEQNRWKHIHTDPRVVLHFIATKSSITYLLTVTVVFKLPLDDYRHWEDIPDSWWTTELGVIYTWLTTTKSFTVIHGTV